MIVFLTCMNTATRHLFKYWRRGGASGGRHMIRRLQWAALTLHVTARQLSGSCQANGGRWDRCRCCARRQRGYKPLSRPWIGVVSWPVRSHAICAIKVLPAVQLHFKQCVNLILYTFDHRAAHCVNLGLPYTLIHQESRM